MNASLRSMSPKAQFAWNDPLLLEQQLSEQERMLRDATQTCCTDKLAPRILAAFPGKTRPRHISRNERTRPARRHAPSGLRQERKGRLGFGHALTCGGRQAV